MNASNEFADIKKFCDKALSREFTSIPRKGSSVWISNDNELIELVYVEPNSSWMPMDKYIKFKAEKKAANIKYYEEHPNELKQRIHVRRYGGRIIRVSSGSIRHIKPTSYAIT
jgi:hypothetical protein